MSERYPRGTVIWAYDKYKKHARTRPWVVMNNGTHPYGGDEYLVVPVTTVSDSHRIKITENDFIDGNLKQTSYATPWAYNSLQVDSCEERAGRVSCEIVQEIREAYLRYTAPEDC